jgi:hypothetical protein
MRGVQEVRLPYYDMTPESRNSLLLGNGSVNSFLRKWARMQQLKNCRFYATAR